MTYKKALNVLIETAQAYLALGCATTVTGTEDERLKLREAVKKLYFQAYGKYPTDKDLDQRGFWTR